MNIKLNCQGLQIRTVCFFSCGIPGNENEDRLTTAGNEDEDRLTTAGNEDEDRLTTAGNEDEDRLTSAGSTFKHTDHSVHRQEKDSRNNSKHHS